MSDYLPPSVAIATTTIATPRPPSAGDGEERHLIAVALFDVEQTEAAEFRYRFAIRTIDPGDSEAELIEWLAEDLPSERVVIGWRLTEDIMPIMLEASEAASPARALEFIDALATIITMDAVDLADVYDGLESSSLDALCAEHGIPTRSMSKDAVLGAWAIDRWGELVATLAINVVATWRAWAQTRVPTDDLPHRFAEAALLRWRPDNESTHIWQDAGEF